MKFDNFLNPLLITLFAASTVVVSIGVGVKATKGFPAPVAFLERNATYEVCAQWYQDTEENLTAIRMPDGQLRVFVLKQELDPGFYQFTGKNLIPLKPNPLRAVSTNHPMAHGK